MGNPDDKDSATELFLKGFRSHGEQAVSKPEADTRTPEPDLMTLFLNGIMSFLKQLFSPDADKDAPNEGGPNPGDTKPSPDGQKAQGDFRQSAQDYFAKNAPQDIAQKLVRLRQQYDPDGTRHIQAISPVRGDVTVTSGFGTRTAPTAGASIHHKGIDVASETELHPAVQSVMPGVVLSAGARKGFGNCVEIEDIYGHKWIYGHLESFSVQAGQEVGQGTQIGIMGNTGITTKDLANGHTGIHLHIEERTADDNVVANGPVIMGQQFKTNNKILYSESNRIQAMQNQPSDTSLAKSNMPNMPALPHLPGLTGVTPSSSSYQPAVTGGPRQGPRSTGM